MRPRLIPVVGVLALVAGASCSRPTVSRAESREVRLLSISSGLVGLGTAPNTSPLHATVAIQNIANATLTLQVKSVSCSCMNTGITPSTIGAGEGAVLTVSIAPGAPGLKRERVSVGVLEDPTYREDLVFEYELYAPAYVLPKAVVFPARDAKARTIELFLDSRSGEDVEGWTVTSPATVSVTRKGVRQARTAAFQGGIVHFEVAHSADAPEGDLGAISFRYTQGSVDSRLSVPVSISR